METLFCNTCGKKTQFSVDIDGYHKRAICLECGKFIKFLSQPLETFVMPFGKHKDELLVEAFQKDRQYFEWLSGVGITSTGLRKRVEELLKL